METREESLERLRRGPAPAVIGLGAIGSWVSRWLTANGIASYGYDDDTVSLKNLGAGAFAPGDVGTRKAVVLNALTHRWERGAAVTHPLLVCADHGPTRRDAARQASAQGVPFVCAKANGAMWQVWHVPPFAPIDDFLAFDEAAELDPVRVACGEPSVGRVASLGAAAELLTAWAGFEVTPGEVEAAYGVAFDPALQHVLAARWSADREAAQDAADAAARKAAADMIDVLRGDSDRFALRALENLRAKRAKDVRRKRSTIHMRAIVYRDAGDTLHDAAVSAARLVARHRPLAVLVAAESRIAARVEGLRLSLPNTITLLEVSA